jgi:hypothetical protein
VLVSSEIPARADSAGIQFQSVGAQRLAGFDRPVELFLCRRSGG